MRQEVNEKIRQRFLARLEEDVDDPVTRQELTPDYPPFCKRVAVHDDYWCASSWLVLVVNLKAFFRCFCLTTEVKRSVEKWWSNDLCARSKSACFF